MTAGRPLKFASADELAAKIQDFFDLVKSGEEAPSVVGLACHLGTNKQTLLNYEVRDEYAPIVHAAKERIEKLFTMGAYGGKIPPAIFIFTAKNHYGYVDGQNLNLGGQNGQNPVEAKLTVEYVNASDT